MVGGGQLVLPRLTLPKPPSGREQRSPFIRERKEDTGSLASPLRRKQSGAWHPSSPEGSPPRPGALLLTLPGPRDWYPVLRRHSPHHCWKDLPKGYLWTRYFSAGNTPEPRAPCRRSSNVSTCPPGHQRMRTSSGERNHGVPWHRPFCLPKLSSIAASGASLSMLFTWGLSKGVPQF